MGKAPLKKGKSTWGGSKYHVDKYISRSAALRRLQVTLKDFRRLCILKGIYPRVPNSKKGFQTGKTYYFTKDIIFLQHEPLLEKYREIKIFSRKLKKAKNSEERKTAKALVARVKPILTFDHLIKERYPSFDAALRDLDDCLTLVTMMSKIDSHIEVKLDAQLDFIRLVREFQNYVVLTRSLRKVFLSVKGIYYQAEILGVAITWLVPYDFHQEVPKEIDFRIMKTFLEFYTTLLEFVNYKLYHTIGMAYPPTYSVQADDAIGALASLTILSEDNHRPVPSTHFVAPSSSANPAKAEKTAAAKIKSLQAASATNALTEEQKQEQEIRLQSLLGSDKMKAIVAQDKQASKSADSDSDIDSDDDEADVNTSQEADTSIEDIDDVEDDDDEDDEEDSDDEEEQLASKKKENKKPVAAATSVEAAVAAPVQEAETFVEYEQRPDIQKKIEALERYKKMFNGLVFFINRECPRSSLEFLIKCFGGQVCWEGKFSPYPADSPKITHHVIDRPIVDNMVQSREYVQPQWVYDSVNAQLRLPMDRYRPAATLPPHLSPFVDYAQSKYVPRYAEEIRQLVAKETGLNVLPGAGIEDAQEEISEEQINAETRYIKELEAERAGVVFSKAKEQGLDKEILKKASMPDGPKKKKGKDRILNEVSVADEERALKESMLSKKKLDIYQSARKQLLRKDRETRGLEERRAKAEKKEANVAKDREAHRKKVETMQMFNESKAAAAKQLEQEQQQAQAQAQAQAEAEAQAQAQAQAQAKAQQEAGKKRKRAEKQQAPAPTTAPVAPVKEAPKQEQPAAVAAAKPSKKAAKAAAPVAAPTPVPAPTPAPVPVVEAPVVVEAKKKPAAKKAKSAPVAVAAPTPVAAPVPVAAVPSVSSKPATTTASKKKVEASPAKQQPAPQQQQQSKKPATKKQKISQ